MPEKARLSDLRPGWFLLLLVIACPLGPANASPPLPPAEIRLPGHGLAIDDASLVSYIRDGLPERLTPTGAAWYGLASRQELYRLVLELLTKRKVAAAVPVLAAQLNSPLPASISNDLVDRTGPPGEQSEESLLYNQCAYRAGCAASLGQIGDPAAVEALTLFLRAQLPVLRDTVGKRHYPPCAGAYGEACVALALLGKEEGIEFLIEALPAVPLDDTWATTDLLIITGQRIGPEPLQPAWVAAAAREKWFAWWRENRDGFSIDPSSIPRRKARPFAPAEPMTLRDYLRAAQYRDMQPPPDSYNPKAVVWLEKNGPEKVDEIAAVVNNPDEAYDIRFEAMEWYLRFGGKKALRDVARYARGDVPFDPADAYMKDFLQRNSFALIEKTSPSFAKRLARQTAKKD